LGHGTWLCFDLHEVASLHRARFTPLGYWIDIGRAPRAFARGENGRRSRQRRL